MSALPIQLIGLQSILEHGYYYSKNIDSEYIDCTENTAAALNLASIKDIKGKTDKCFGWSNQRIATIRKHDLKVINSKRSVYKIEQPFISGDEKKLHLLSLKFPIFKSNKLIGISGISFDLNSSLLSFDNNKNIQKVNPLFESLSTREQQCVTLYLNGKTAKETAALMGLSFRTIEEYFSNIKKKLNCKNKRDILTLLNNIHTP